MIFSYSFYNNLPWDGTRKQFYYTVWRVVSLAQESHQELRFPQSLIQLLLYLVMSSFSKSCVVRKWILLLHKRIQYKSSTSNYSLNIALLNKVSIWGYILRIINSLLFWDLIGIDTNFFIYLRILRLQECSFFIQSRFQNTEMYFLPIGRYQSLFTVLIPELTKKTFTLCLFVKSTQFSFLYRAHEDTYHMSVSPT